MCNGFPALQLRQEFWQFIRSIVWDKHRDGLPHNLLKCVAKDSFGGFVPTENMPVQCLADNRVIRRFHNGGQVTKSFLRLFALGDVPVDFENPRRLTVKISLQYLATRHDNGGTVVRDVAQFSFPYPRFHEASPSFLHRFGELGLQEVMGDFAQRLILFPSVGLFGSSIPVHDPVVQITDKNCVVGEIEQIGLFLQGLICHEQLSGALPYSYLQFFTRFVKFAEEPFPFHGRGNLVGYRLHEGQILGRKTGAGPGTERECTQDRPPAISG